MVSYLNLLPLYQELSGGVHSLLLHIAVTEVPPIFTDADSRTKGGQIGDDEIKQ